MKAVSARLAQVHHTLQDVSQMTQLVLEVLRRLVRGLREYAEGCHISEIGFLVKEAQIALIGFPVSDHPGGRLHIRRNPQARREIISCPRRYVSDRHKGLVRMFHHAADHFVEGAVSARAHHIQIVFFPGPYKVSRVSPASCGIACDHIIFP